MGFRVHLKATGVPSLLVPFWGRSSETITHGLYWDMKVKAVHTLRPHVLRA